MFVNQSLHVRQICFPQEIDLSVVHAVGIEVISSEKSVALTCIYNPPTALYRCDQAVCNIIDYVCTRYHLVSIVGDFNMHEVAVGLNVGSFIASGYDEFVNTIVQYDFEQMVSEPTRGERFLDLVFCNKYVSCSDIFLLPLFSCSDQAALTFCIFIETQCSIDKLQNMFNSKKFDFESYGSYLSNIDWQNVLAKSDSVDDV